MKKGISQPMIAIILGIIFIVIVLLVFGNPLKKYVEDMFTKGVFNSTTKTNQYGVGKSFEIPSQKETGESADSGT